MTSHVERIAQVTYLHTRNFQQSPEFGVCLPPPRIPLNRLDLLLEMSNSTHPRPPTSSSESARCYGSRAVGVPLKCRTKISPSSHFDQTQGQSSEMRLLMRNTEPLMNLTD